MTEGITRSNLERLVKYYQYILSVLSEGRDFITSGELSELFKISDSMVRRDFNAFKLYGTPRVGYSIPELCQEIPEILGFSLISRGIIVGAGNLGMAIANYSGFTQIGLHIIALFDNSSSRIDRMVGTRKVQDFRLLASFIKMHKPEVGIITVPAKNAQNVADILVENGVMGIWDFSGERLRIPEGVVMKHADLAIEWSVLSHRINNRVYDKATVS